MAYQMEGLLSKCELDDFKLILGHIDSYVNFTDDDDLAKTLADYECNPTPHNKQLLIRLIETEIRYLGSSDFAYAKRKLIGGLLWKNDEPAGVGIDEIIADVSDKFGVKHRLVGTVEARLERLAKHAAEKTFFSLTPAQQRELFDKAGVDKKIKEAFFDEFIYTKKFLPLLLKLAGPLITTEIIESIALSIAAKHIGNQVVKEVAKNIAARFALVEWLGPIVWSLFVGSLIIDMQGPAFRKTIPIIVYLGIVALRDGPESCDVFRSEDAA